ncbi:MAG: ATPase, T2SS/T4P/T4SS family [Candidatus Nanoarchaeia archaeon]
MEIDRYNLHEGGINIHISIQGTKGWASLYVLALPQLTPPTTALLEEIKNKIIVETTLSPTELLDPKIVETLKQRFKKRAEELLIQLMPSLSDHAKKVFVLKIIHDMLGLGDLEFLQKDELIEEIVVNSAKEPVRIYHKIYGWLITNITLQSEAQIANYSEIIARRVGRQITTLTPLLDAHLVTGDRANAVLYPISNKGNTITIRKFARDPWTVTDFIKSKTCTSDIFALIWLAVQYEMNIIISGGTASGKCVIGDTPIYLADGSRKKIKELTEEHFVKKQVFSDNGWEFVYAPDLSILTMDPTDLKIKKQAVSKIWRHQAPPTLVKVRSRSGREVVVTPEHPFFTLKNGELTSLRADQLVLQQRIATPRIIPLFDEKKSSPLTFLETLKNIKGLYVPYQKESIKQLRLKLFDIFKADSIPKLASILGYNKMTLRSWLSKNAIPLSDYISLFEKANLPINPAIPLKSKTSPFTFTLSNLIPDLFRFLALLISDGHLTRDYCEFHNSNQVLLQEFLQLGKKLFNVHGKISYPKNRVSKTVFHSTALTTALHHLFNIPFGNKARTVVIPPQLWNENNESVKQFISGVIDCEGYVGPHSLEIGMASPEFIEGLTTLFLRFGIIATVNHSQIKDCSRILVSGPENFHKFSDFQLRHQEKKEALSHLLLKQTQLTHNLDLIPAQPELIKRLRYYTGFSQKEFAQHLGISRRLVGRWEDGSRNFSYSTFNKLSSLFDQEDFPMFNAISESDVFWDEITEINILKNHKQKYVYDLTVDGTHNFIAGNVPFVVHNTTALNICTAFIPTKHRVLSIEDTRELQLPKFLYWAPMTTRLPNPEGEGGVSMLDLLVNALRMRPDRIILGEIRRQQEAEVLFEAMYTGHSVYATVHAETVQETITRLTNPPISVPANLLNAVHLNVAMFRDRKTGLRRVSEVGEFLLKDKNGRIVAEPNLLYVWKPATDKIIAQGRSTHLFKELTRTTGMTPKELKRNLAEKKQVLEWMVKNNIREIDEVGMVMKEYYKDPQFIYKVARGNKSLKSLGLNIEQQW